ncbi:hypothetical protein GCM10018987_44610 [Streptomyces cremeus]
MAAAVPVVAGTGEEGAHPGPSALTQLLARFDEFGVVEGRVGRLFAATAAEKGRRRGHPRGTSTTRDK